MSAENDRKVDTEDEDDEQLRSEGKLSLLMEYNQDVTRFVVRQSALGEKVKGGVAKKYGLDAAQIVLLLPNGVGRLDAAQSLKVNGLEAGKTYRLNVVIEQVGGNLFESNPHTLSAMKNEV